MSGKNLRTDRRAPTAELHCRPSTSAIVPLDRAYSRLDGLVEADAVEAVDVSTWPGRVTLTDREADEALDELDPEDDRERAVRTLRAFERWADDEGVSLAPAFKRQSYESSFTGESGVAIRFPILALAVREGGELRAVYPHDDDGTVTVEEGVERLASRLGYSAGGSQRSRALGE